MPKLKAFSLIELLIVIVLIGIVSVLVISFRNLSSFVLTPSNLREFLYPNGKIYIFEDGSNLVVLKDKNITNINIKINLPEVFAYKNDNFEKKIFNDINDKRVVFRYEEKNGIGESFILKTDSGYYIFKPFEIKKVSDFEIAKDIFLLTKYKYKEGEVY